MPNKTRQQKSACQPFRLTRLLSSQCIREPHLAKNHRQMGSHKQFCILHGWLPLEGKGDRFAVDEVASLALCILHFAFCRQFRLSFRGVLCDTPHPRRARALKVFAFCPLLVVAKSAYNCFSYAEKQKIAPLLLLSPKTKIVFGGPIKNSSSSISEGHRVKCAVFLRAGDTLTESAHFSEKVRKRSIWGSIKIFIAHIPCKAASCRNTIGKWVSSNNFALTGTVAYKSGVSSDTPQVL